MVAYGRRTVTSTRRHSCPSARAAAIKGLTPEQVLGTGSQIILNNAYHLMLRPGAEVVARLGGVHRFMGWPGPILTDSGGYQAYSLSDMNAIDEDGVTFASIVDGSTVHLTPERSIEVQNLLGADIIMAFDDCPPSVEPRHHVRRQFALRSDHVAAMAARRLRKRIIDADCASPTSGPFAGWSGVASPIAVPTSRRSSGSFRAERTSSSVRRRSMRSAPWTCRDTPSAAWRWGKDRS